MQIEMIQGEESLGLFLKKSIYHQVYVYTHTHTLKLKL